MRIEKLRGSNLAPVGAGIVGRGAGHDFDHIGPAAPVQRERAKVAGGAKHAADFLGQFLTEEERYSDAGSVPCTDPHQIQRDALDRLKALLNEHMNDERLLLTWFGQFMTEPRYPELVAGPELEEDDLLASLEDGAVLVRNPSARLAWSDVDDDLLLFASGQSRLLPGNLRELLKLICAADALHSDNLGQWLADDEGRNLLLELVKQGSLEFADE